MRGFGGGWPKELLLRYASLLALAVFRCLCAIKAALDVRTVRR